MFLNSNFFFLPTLYFSSGQWRSSQTFDSGQGDCQGSRGGHRHLLHHQWGQWLQFRYRRVDGCYSCHEATGSRKSEKLYPGKIRNGIWISLKFGWLKTKLGHFQLLANRGLKSFEPSLLVIAQRRKEPGCPQ